MTEAVLTQNANSNESLTTHNGVTVKQLLVGLTSLQCEWEPDGFDAWTGRCPCCSGNKLAIRTNDDGTAEVDCPSTDCSRDTILTAALTPSPDEEQEPLSKNVPAVTSSVSQAPKEFSESLVPMDSTGPLGLRNYDSMATTQEDTQEDTLEDTLEDALTKVICETQPTESESRTTGPLSANRLAWNFVRHLKSIPALKGREISEVYEILMPAVAEWHNLAKTSYGEPAAVPPFDEFKSHCIVCWIKTRKGIDENALAEAIKLARLIPYRPDELEDKAAIVAAVCRNLAAMNDSDGEFFLTQRDAAKACEAPAKATGEAQLMLLEHVHKLIQTIRPGDSKKRKATWFRWIGLN